MRVPRGFGRRFRERRGELSEGGQMRVVAVVGGIALAVFWVAAATPAGGGDAAKGKETYAKFCASCHGNAGKGDGPGAAALNPKPKDLTDKAYMAKLNDQYLADITAKGGAAVGKSPLMPPWGAALKAEEIQNVVAFLRSLGR